MNTMLVRTILAGIALAPCGAAADETPFELPATPPGVVARGFFDALAAEGKEPIETFLKTHGSKAWLAKRPIEQRISVLSQMRGMLGTLTPGAVATDEPTKIVVLARAAAQDAWFECTFEVETDPPHKLASMQLMPGPAPDEAERELGDWEGLADLLEAARVESGAPAIAGAVVHGGRVVEEAVVGVRMAGGEETALTSDRFHLGSIGKSLTSTMVGRLVEEGVLAWDVPLADALPGFPMREEYMGVTLDQLLTHRGGLPPYLTFDDAEEARLEALPGPPRAQRAAFLAEALQQDPASEPGTTFLYSNAGYALAGHIAECAAGKSYETLMSALVFDPLEMTSAGTGWPATDARPDEPRGHGIVDGEITPRRLDALGVGTYLAPAGDLHASARDLARFAAMHLAGLAGEDGLLRAETVERLHTPAKPGETPAYGRGWMIDGPVHWHAGLSGAFYALLHLVPERDLAVVVLINSGSIANDALAKRIAAAVEQRYAAEPRAAEGGD